MKRTIAYIEIQGYYGTWETVCTECEATDKETRAAAKAQIACYRENEPGVAFRTRTVEWDAIRRAVRRSYNELTRGGVDPSEAAEQALTVVAKDRYEVASAIWVTRYAVSTVYTEPVGQVDKTIIMWEDGVFALRQQLEVTA